MPSRMVEAACMPCWPHGPAPCHPSLHLPCCCPNPPTHPLHPPPQPNLHFNPCAPVTSTFDNDVYVATSEPHGNIEAVVTRAAGVQPHCRL